MNYAFFNDKGASIWGALFFSRDTYLYYAVHVKKWWFPRLKSSMSIGVVFI